MKCDNVSRTFALTERAEFSGNKTDYSIIVHSHLDWDWVWQRPQQFLSRLSNDHKILFVEGPKPTERIHSSSSCVREVRDYPNLLVVESKIPAARWSDGEWVDRERRHLLQTLLSEPIGHDFDAPVQWFYDPMAVPAFAGQMNEIAIVYDCMDQLSQFRFSPPELAKRERELLAIADVVFAGGPKIWAEKRRFNKNCVTVGCGVDVRHFAKSKSRNCPIADDIADLPRPIYGYMGVIDERIDYNLVARLADSNPTGSVVMVGPTAKIDTKILPARKNLHWLGMRNYSSLPSYAKAFDVCLMPFALNDATQYINPTKALEYMATETPIVSTAIEDVVLQFSDVVVIADTVTTFVAACASAVRKPNQARVQRGLNLANKNTWDFVVQNLKQEIEAALNIAARSAVTAA